MNRTKPQRPMRTVKILKVVSAVLSLAFWIASCLLWYHYVATRPSQPDAAVGRVYAERQIEQVFYLTATERSIWYLLTGAGVSCFLLGVGSHMFGKLLDGEMSNETKTMTEQGSNP
jgi:hypothetical protein